MLQRTDGRERSRAIRRDAPLIRILHVSDLHAAEPANEGQELLPEAALDHAAALLDGRQVHLLVCSGDLTKSSDPREYESGYSLLLEPAMRRFGLEPRQVILVPGNHEIAQTELDRVPSERPTTADPILEDPEELSAAMAPLEQWLAFYREFYGDDMPAQPGPLSFVHEYELEGASVGVAALNSTWLSRVEGDKGHLLLGHRQVEPALRAIADKDIRLVVVHHPFDWLTELDARETQEEFAKRGVTVLSGHLHSPDATAQQSSGGEILSLRAGCLYVHPKFPNSYSLIEIDPTLRIASVLFRRWYSTRSAFDADLEIAPDGHEEFPLPLSRRERERGHPHFSDVMRSIAETADSLASAP